MAKDIEFIKNLFSKKRNNDKPSTPKPERNTDRPSAPKPYHVPSAMPTSKSSNRITINGITIECSSGNIDISNGKVTVDGKAMQDIKASDPTRVVITGSVNSLSTTGNVEVRGNVLGNIDAGGSVQCDNVGGDIDAGGSVQCDDVDGDIDAGGSVISG